eukprot:403331505
MSSSRRFLNKSQISAGFIPKFREQGLKKSLSELKDDIERGANDGVRLDKELVQKLINDNNSKIQEVVVHQDVADMHHMTNEERVKKLEMKLKNQYIERLKGTFGKMRENNRVDYSPSHETSFLGARYKKERDQINISQLANSTISYLDKLQTQNKNIFEQKKLSTIPSRLEIASHSSLSPPPLNFSRQQLSPMNQLDLKNKNILFTPLNQHQKQPNIGSYIQLDFNSMKNSLRVLKQFDALLNDDSVTHLQNDQDNEDIEDFQEHIDELLDKLTKNHSTFFKEVPAQQAQQEEEKYKTSVFRKVQSINANYDKILQKVSERSLHQTFMNEMLEKQIFIKDQSLRKNTRSVLPTIVTPRMVSNQDSLLNKVHQEMKLMRNTSKDVKSLLRPKASIEQYEQLNKSFGLSSKQNSIKKIQYQVSLPKIINKSSDQGLISPSNVNQDISEVPQSPSIIHEDPNETTGNDENTVKHQNVGISASNTSAINQTQENFKNDVELNYKLQPLQTKELKINLNFEIDTQKSREFTTKSYRTSSHAVQTLRGLNNSKRPSVYSPVGNQSESPFKQNQSSEELPQINKNKSILNQPLDYSSIIIDKEQTKQINKPIKSNRSRQFQQAQTLIAQKYKNSKKNKEFDNRFDGIMTTLKPQLSPRLSGQNSNLVTKNNESQTLASTQQDKKVDSISKLRPHSNLDDIQTKTINQTVNTVFDIRKVSAIASTIMNGDQSYREGGDQSPQYSSQMASDFRMATPKLHTPFGQQKSQFQRDQAVQ